MTPFVTAPLAKDGKLKVREDGFTVGIEQVQLEQVLLIPVYCPVIIDVFPKDTAKTTKSSSGTALIDLNRAGAGLLEIVSRPDMRCNYSCSN